MTAPAPKCACPGGQIGATMCPVHGVEAFAPAPAPEGAAVDLTADRVNEVVRQKREHIEKMTAAWITENPGIPASEAEIVEVHGADSIRFFVRRRDPPAPAPAPKCAATSRSGRPCGGLLGHSGDHWTALRDVLAPAPAPSESNCDPYEPCYMPDCEIAGKHYHAPAPAPKCACPCPEHGEVGYTCSCVCVAHGIPQEDIDGMPWVHVTPPAPAPSERCADSLHDGIRCKREAGHPMDSEMPHKNGGYRWGAAVPPAPAPAPSERLGPSCAKCGRGYYDLVHWPQDCHEFEETKP